MSFSQTTVASKTVVALPSSTSASLLSESLIAADEVLVVRKAVKRLTLRVRPNGQIEMVGPRRLSNDEFEQFYRQKRDWVRRVKDRQAHQQAKKPQLSASEFLLHDQIVDILALPSSEPAEFFSKANSNPTLPAKATAMAALQKTFHQQQKKTDPTRKQQAYRRYAQAYLPIRLQQLSDQHDLPFGKTSIRAQRTRWGSCSAAGNISLNWRLIQMPGYVCDYVLLHELAHTRHMNHSPSFWQLVEKISPNTARSKDWLRQRGSYLPD